MRASVSEVVSVGFGLWTVAFFRPRRRPASALAGGTSESSFIMRAPNRRVTEVCREGIAVEEVSAVRFKGFDSDWKVRPVREVHRGKDSEGEEAASGRLPGDLHRDHLCPEGPLGCKMEREAESLQREQTPNWWLHQSFGHEGHALARSALLPVRLLGQVSSAVDVMVEVYVPEAGKNTPLLEGVETGWTSLTLLESGDGGSLEKNVVEGNSECLGVQRSAG